MTPAFSAPVTRSRTLALVGRAGRVFGSCLVYLVILLLILWPALALYFDLPFAHLRLAAAILYPLTAIAALTRVHAKSGRLLVAILGCALIAAWWLTLKASNDKPWQTDVSQLATIDVNDSSDVSDVSGAQAGLTSGRQVTIHNFRQCNYRAELDYTCRWSTQSFPLANIRGVDLFIDFWGATPAANLIAHTILSFDIAPGPDTPERHVAFSIETRKQVGQTYSAVRGFFRQFTLISVVSDERDVVRLRTNYRQGENLYIYHTKATPAFAQRLFLSYVALTNNLAIQPAWYNAITHNCTTEIYTFQAMRGQPYDWRILLNGKADEMLYQQDALAGNLSFSDLKQHAYINPAAKAANTDPNFSEKIRENRPGFTAQ